MEKYFKPKRNVPPINTSSRSTTEFKAKETEDQTRGKESVVIFGRLTIQLSLNSMIKEVSKEIIWSSLYG